MNTIWYILGCLLVIGIFSIALLGVIILKQCRTKHNKVCEIKTAWRIHHKYLKGVIMNNHEHTECEHEMAYCKVCKIPYCKKCGKEWMEKSYTYTANPWNGGAVTLCGGGSLTTYNFCATHTHQ